MDLEMSRHYPQRGALEWDYCKGNLDEQTADDLHLQIVQLSRSMGQAFVIVTHNKSLAAHADRVLVLSARGLTPYESVGPADHSPE